MAGEKAGLLPLETGGLWKMKLLELNHVEKSFGDLPVLKDISMSVEDGEIVSIIGPSGSGKSTSCAALPCWRPWIGEKLSIWAKRRCGEMKTALSAMLHQGS